MLALVLGPDGPALDPAHPFTPRPGEAVVRPILAGVCATDLELVKGYMGFSGVLGHEVVGVVESHPDPSWKGARVVSEINCPCTECPTCRSGRPTHCPHRTVLGIAGRDGVFAERFCIPVANLHRVPDAIEDSAAVFVEPLAAALRVLERAHLRPSHRVVVLGAGRLGQLTCRVLALTGARVQAVDPRPDRLDLLPAGIEGHGAPEGLQGADAVVECTGSPAGLQIAARLVRPRGTLVLKTTIHGQAPADLTPWVVDELTLVGSRCGPFEPALRLLEAGLVDPRPLVEATLPLQQGVQALELARTALKVLVEIR